MDYLTDAFEKFIGSYDLIKDGMSLKYFHSYAVMRLMIELARKLKLSEEEVEIASIIGLLHDIGRFEQIKTYDVISDVKSGMDHALYGVNYLFDEGHIRDFVISDKYDDIIKEAIFYHNKKDIPTNLGKKEIFVKMIRDMDKLDIYRVNAAREFSFSINDLTKEVYDDFMSCQTVDVRNEHTKTDEIVFMLAFVYDLNFKETVELFSEKDYANKFIESINVEPGSEELFNRIVSIFKEKMDSLFKN